MSFMKRRMLPACLHPCTILLAVGFEPLFTSKPGVMLDFFSTFVLHIIPSVFSSDGKFQFGTLINILV